MPRTRKNAKSEIAQAAGPTQGESRRRIVDAAMSLFAERGFDATATKAIADRAEVPSSLLFYYFPTKESLLEELFKGENLSVVARRAFEEVDRGDPTRTLTAIATQMFRWMEANREHSLVFFKEMTSHRDISARLLKTRENVIALFASYLDKQVREGNLMPMDSRAVGNVITSSIMFAALVDNPNKAEPYAKKIIEIALGKYVPEGPPQQKRAH